MDFNIKDHIEKLKEKIHYQSDEKKIIKIISALLSRDVSCVVSLKKGILYLSSMDSIMRTQIKLKKNTIIEQAKKQDIYIRDII